MAVVEFRQLAPAEAEALFSRYLFPLEMGTFPWCLRCAEMSLVPGHFSSLREYETRRYRLI